MECSWSVASSGPDESSQVVLVTGDLDVVQDRQHDQKRLSQVLARVFPSTVHLV